MSGRIGWALDPEGVAHLPKLHGAELLITRCQRSLPPELGQCGWTPDDHQRCPRCFAASPHSAALSPEDLPRGISTRYSQSFLDRVIEEVRVRSVLREVITLAEQASALSDPQMQAQLTALAGTARAGCPKCRSTDQAPAAHQLRVLPMGSP